MPLLDMQRRGQQIGRIRMGELVQGSNGKPRPTTLTAFRLTTGSRPAAQMVAEVLGGEVKEWKRGQFEIYTERDALMVMVPPRDEVITQWYEMWNKGGCMRRCDSRIEQLSGKPCMCPHAEDPEDLEAVEEAALERLRLAQMNPPKACKVITRLNVMIPDLLGLGVWRIDSSSYYAAIELGDTADLMSVARERGIQLPAVLRIDRRERVAGGTTKRFPVPVLEVLATYRQIVTGQIAQGGIAAQLPPSMQAAKAIEAAPPASGAPQSKRPEQVTAQGIADQSAKAATRAEVEDLATLASGEELLEDHVDTGGGVFEELDAFLKHRWKTLPRAAEDDTDGAA